jgi:hypothetical protein
MKKTDLSVIRSDPTKLVLLRLLAPLLVLASGILVFGRQFPSWRTLFVVPYVLVAFFLMSLAELRVGQSEISYRRVHGWKELKSEDVLRSGTLWPGAIGYMKFKYFAYPWGRLFFILDESNRNEALRRDGSPMLLRIRRTKESTIAQHEDEPKTRRAQALSRLTISAAGGLAFALLMQRVVLSSPESVLHPYSRVPSEPWLQASARLVTLMNSLPVAVLGIALFCYLTISSRDRIRSYLYGFMAGLCCYSIFLRL